MHRTLDRQQIMDGVSAGPQPGRREVAALAREGFRSVIDLRAEGEPGQVWSLEREAREVRSASMESHSMALLWESLRPVQVIEFRSLLRRVPHPVYVHSVGGRRAVLLALIHRACEEGLDAGRVSELARAFGVELLPRERELVRRCLDAERSALAL